MKRLLILLQSNICETTEGVRSYTGYIHLPPGTLNDVGVTDQDYPINTFFWFFESRHDPANAPLAMWLNGGPGASSMLGMLNGNGPCYVHADSNSTYLNEWSWNAYSNMLYIDQPVQVGFSYDRLQNITKNLATNSVSLLEPNDDIPEQNTTFLVGTSPSRESNNTAQGVRNAAKAVWHFMQTFTQEFPAYQPNNSKISVTTESFVSR